MDYFRTRREERRQKPRPNGRMARAWRAVVNFFFYCIVHSPAVEETVQVEEVYQSSEASMRPPTNSLYNELFHNRSSHEPKHFNMKGSQQSVIIAQDINSHVSLHSAQSGRSSKNSGNNASIVSWGKTNNMTPVESVASIGFYFRDNIAPSYKREEVTVTPRLVQVQEYVGEVVSGGTIPDVYKLIKRTLNIGYTPVVTYTPEHRLQTEKENLRNEGSHDLRRCVSMSSINKPKIVLKRSVSMTSMKLKTERSSSGAVEQKYNKVEQKKNTSKQRNMFSWKKSTIKGSHVKDENQLKKEKYFKSFSMPSLRNFFSTKKHDDEGAAQSGQRKEKRTRSLPSFSGLFRRKSSTSSKGNASEKTKGGTKDSAVKKTSLENLHTVFNDSIINIEVLLGLKKPKNSYEALAVAKEFGSEKPYWLRDEEAERERIETLKNQSKKVSDESIEESRYLKNHVDDIDSGVASRGVSSNANQSLT